MWFYNSNNNRSNDREENRDAHRSRQEQQPVRNVAREAAAEVVELGRREAREEIREQMPAFARESVEHTAEWFDHMIETQQPRPAFMAAQPAMTGGTMPIMSTRPQPTMTSLYPAIPDPTEETPASRATAEAVSRQIDGQGYWVTDEPASVGLQMTGNMQEINNLAANNEGFIDPNAVG